ncbi:unnamed protein product [Scytosiphon promiscuus]
MPSVQQCVICYDELTDGLSAAPCGHVFHSFCIERWNGPKRCCPICHARLPPQLLKLYYEPQKDSQDDPATGTCTSASACAIVSGNPTAEAGTGKLKPVPAEVTQLRRQLASSTKVIEADKEHRIKQGKELLEMRRQLVAAQVAALESQAEHEATVAATGKRLETCQIELIKKNKDNNKLKREMEATSKRLRDYQGEKVAYSYLSQFASPARGRALTGLGQVDVEKVLDQIRQGNARAETVIRGQHEQLTNSIDREQKTKRELRKTKLESETVSLELQHVRSRLTRAKKEAHHLEKIVAKTTASATRSNGQVPRGVGATTPVSPSAGALLGDWVAEERPCKNGGESKWALSRKSVKGGGALGETKELKRSAPVGGGNGARAATAAGPTGLKSAKRQRTEKQQGKEEEEDDDDLVSLGSDDDGDGDDDDNVVRARDGGDLGRCNKSGATWHSALNTSALTKPPAPLRSFFRTSAAAKAGGGGTGAVRNRKPAKFINKGHNAVGGRHQVRLSSASFFSQNPFCLGGKDSRHAPTSSTRLQ